MTKSVTYELLILLNMIHVYIVFSVLYIQDINIVRYFYMYNICYFKNSKSQNKYRL